MPTKHFNGVRRVKASRLIPDSHSPILKKTMIQQVRTFYREHARDIIAQYWLPIVAVIAAVLIGFRWIDPAPPKQIEIGIGFEDNAFAGYAEQYKAILARDKVTVNFMRSSGSPQNLAQMMDDNSTVNVGFIQGGLPNLMDATNLSSLGSVYHEPFWVFVRAEAGAPKLTRFSQLKGKRIAIGRLGGGARKLATRVLSASGVTLENSELLELSGDEAADAVLKGTADAAVFVTTLEATHVRKLFAAPNVALVSLEQAEAYVKTFPFLHHVVLPRGGVDLEKNLPPDDVHLVAPTVMLAVRGDIHPAMITLLLKAATEIHSTTGLMQKKGEFPSDKDTELPLNPDAQRFYKSGPPFLQKYLPFWVATFVDRMFFILLPLLAVLIPIVKLAPVIYSWRIRSKVYHWYGELKFLEGQIRDQPGEDKLPGYLERLDWIEDQVNRIRLPLAFSNHVYFLREHIDLVRNSIMRASRASRAENRTAIESSGNDG